MALLMLLAPAAHAAKGDCSQPSSTGPGPAASDCLFILRAAVGSLSCTPPCICAPTGALPPKSSDSLRCLRRSVGQDVALDCPCTEVPDGDDFNDNSNDPERWGSDIVFFGSGALLETSERLELRVTSPTGIHYPLRPWIASRVPYSDDWSAQVDLTNLSNPDVDGELSSFGIIVSDENNFLSKVFFELYASHVEAPPARRGFYAGIDNDGVFVAEVVHESDQPVSYGAVRVVFDATTKVLSLYYDESSLDGDDWELLGSFGLDGSGGSFGDTDWGLEADDGFAFALYGYAQELAIPAGDVYGDNFLITGGVAP